MKANLVIMMKCKSKMFFFQGKPQVLPPPDDGHEACTSRPGNKESCAGEGRLARLLQSVAGGRAPGHGQQEHEVNNNQIIASQNMWKLFGLA